MGSLARQTAVWELRKKFEKADRGLVAVFMDQFGKRVRYLSDARLIPRERKHASDSVEGGSERQREGRGVTHGERRPLECPLN
eukprot:1420403-Rhodomonas_salina.1